MDSLCLCSRTRHFANQFLAAHQKLDQYYSGIIPARVGPNTFVFQFDRSELVGLVIVPVDQAAELGKRITAAAEAFDYMELATG